MSEKRTPPLSARQFLVCGLTDLSEEDLDALPSPSLAPVLYVAFGLVLTLAVLILTWVR